MAVFQHAGTDAELASLNRSARDAMMAGNYPAAVSNLRAALAIDSGLVSLWLNLAAALRSSGDNIGAAVAVDEALKREPRNFNALLMRGSLLDQPGNELRAAKAYSAALLFKPMSVSDPATVAAIERAEACHKNYLAGLLDAVDSSISRLESVIGTPIASNAKRFADLLTGRVQTYLPRPVHYYFPGLPVREFFERELLPWIEKFETFGDSIRQELTLALGSHQNNFVPYVNEDETLPLDQWAALNRSTNWSSLHLIANGRSSPEMRALFPKTFEALSCLPQPDVPGRTPSAMFSALQPRTRIPPHHGVSNARLVLHLPLIVPDKCGFRVGSETRYWKVGEAWVFDDTIEHEAWNDSDELRVILIADIWNVFMNDVERQVYREIVTAVDRFNEEPQE